MTNHMIMRQEMYSKVTMTRVSIFCTADFTLMVITFNPL